MSLLGPAAKAPQLGNLFVSLKRNNGLVDYRESFHMVHDAASKRSMICGSVVWCESSLVIEGALVLPLCLRLPGHRCTEVKSLYSWKLSWQNTAIPLETVAIVPDSVHLMAAVAVAVYDFIEQGYPP